MTSKERLLRSKQQSKADAIIDAIKRKCTEIALECLVLEDEITDENSPYDEWSEGRFTGMSYVLNELKLILDKN